MALSGVRSSWLMLETNCDLCSLAYCSWRFLSSISLRSRVFSMAITAWAAKFAYQLDLLLGERPDLPSRTWHHYSYLKGNKYQRCELFFRQRRGDVLEAHRVCHRQRETLDSVGQDVILLR